MANMDMIAPLNTKRFILIYGTTGFRPQNGRYISRTTNRTDYLSFVGLYT